MVPKLRGLIIAVKQLARTPQIKALQFSPEPRHLNPTKESTGSHFPSLHGPLWHLLVCLELLHVRSVDHGAVGRGVQAVLVQHV